VRMSSLIDLDAVLWRIPHRLPYPAFLWRAIGTAPNFRSGIRYGTPHCSTAAAGSSGAVEVAEQAQFGGVMDELVVDVLDEADHRAVAERAGGGTEGLPQPGVVEAGQVALPGGDGVREGVESERRGLGDGSRRVPRWPAPFDWGRQPPSRR